MSVRASQVSLQWFAQQVLLLAAFCVLAAGCRTTPRSSLAPCETGTFQVSDARFAEHLGAVLGVETVAGNHVVELANGRRFVPAMLEAIRSARQSVCLESYIYWSDEIGGQFSEALAERARAGVAVSMLLDWVGSRYFRGRDANRLREAGVELRYYHRHAWLTPGRLNHRDHRKLLVVDGRIGFVGGAGMANVWMGDGCCAQHWRDSFFSVEGPAVSLLQQAFEGQWRKEFGEPPKAGATGLQPEVQGSMKLQSVPDPGRARPDRIYTLYREAIAAARRHVRIGIAYFVPDRVLVDALVAARRRGVSVDILIPGEHMDSKIVTPASRARWGELLRAGVRIHIFQPAMYHSKVLIVDDHFTSIGSANLDPRSLWTNDEINVNVFSQEFAADQIRQFELDCRQAREVTLDQWRRRSILQRISEALVWPVTPLL